MGDTKIEWTDATWNVLAGCSRVSEGCRHCYAEQLSATRLRQAPKYAGVASMTASGARWAQQPVRLNESALDEPLRWTRPRRVFVNSMSDTFHESLPVSTIDAMFAVMALAQRHTFQVLTKRPQRALDYLADQDTPERVARYMPLFSPSNVNRVVPDRVPEHLRPRWPLGNVWLGTSTEDQRAADERVPLLLEAPAAVRFVSAEPLLGEVNLEHWFPWWRHCAKCNGILPGGCSEHPAQHYQGSTGLDWVIVGGESGREARPMRPSWARSLRDQCVGAGVAFFFKQWGEWVGGDYFPPGKLTENRVTMTDGRQCEVVDFGAGEFVARVGKKAAGRLLDGREWNETPRGGEVGC